MSEVQNRIQFYQLNCDGRAIVESNIPRGSDNICLFQEPYLVNGKPGALRIRDFVSTPEGRAAIYVPDLESASFMKIPSLIRNDLVAGLLEFENYKIIIASMYMPGKDKDKKDIKDPISKDLTDLLEYCRKYNFGLICGADANAWSRTWFSERKKYKGYELPWQRGKKLEEYFLENNISVINDYPCPTYMSRGKNKKTTSSTIDITFTWNLDIPIFDWHVDYKCVLSDHKPITYKFNCPKVEQQLVRNYFKADWDRYRKIMEAEMPPVKEGDWSQLRIEEETDIFYKYHYRALDIACPERKRRKKKEAEWWNEDCETAKNAFKSLQRKVFRHKRKPTDEEWQEIKKCRRIWSKTVLKAKKEAWREFTSEINSISDMAKLAAVITKPHAPPIGLLRKPDGSMCSSSEETLGVLMEEHFPKCEVNKKLPKHPKREKHALVHIPWINVKVLKSAIKEFGPHKAPGLDGIKPIVMQNLPDAALARLNIIFTACIQLEYTPHSWRKSKVIFMAKPGKPDKANPRAYRPLSMNSYCLKTLEKCVKYHLEDEVFRENPLHHQQFAFQKDKGTDNALSNTVNLIEEGLLQKQYVIAVFLDIKGAFDNITPQAISKALDDCRIPTSIKNWYMNLLRNRNCECTIGNNTVEAILKTGITQGSVLSPPLGWNPPMNNLVITIDIEPVGQGAFADDEALVSRADNPQTAYLRAQRAVDKAVEWADRHGLQFSAAKTQVLFMTKNKKYEMPPRIKIYGEEVPYSNEAKYLGVTIDKSLTWHKHITEKIASVKRTLMLARGAIAHAWGPKPKFLLWLWTSVMRPRITYGSIVWAKAAERQTIINKMRSLQGHALRMIAPVRRGTPIRALEILYSIEPLHLHIKYLAMSTAIRIDAMMSWTTHLKQKGHIEYAITRTPRSLQGAILDKIPYERNWDLDLKLVIGDGKVDDWRAEDKDFSCFTDGSLMKGESGAGAAIYNKQGEVCTLGEKPTNSTVFQAEIWAIDLAAKKLLEDNIKGCSIGFYVDNQAALRAVTATHCTQLTVKRARQALCALSFDNYITLTWVKSHRGKENRAAIANEMADWAARQATQIDRASSISAPIAMANAKMILKASIWDEWRREWWQYPKARQSKYFLEGPSTKFKKLTNYGRHSIGRLIQFITGHAFLRRHNNIVAYGSKDNDGNNSCRLCKESVEETPHHIITECDDLTEWRNAYFFTRKLNKYEYNWNLYQMTGFLSLPDFTEFEVLVDDDEE